MNRYEELKSKQKAALIVVFTLGLAAVPIALNWNSNLFEGTTFDQGPMHIVCKILSFLFLTALCALSASQYAEKAEVNRDWISKIQEEITDRIDLF